MVWTINYDEKVEKDFKKLFSEIKIRIIKYINEKIAINPLELGGELKGNLQGLRKYRVGDYRIICAIREDIVTVLVLSVGHRKDIYKTKQVSI